MGSTIPLKQLHATTGEYVRRAAKSRTPIVITDRGQPMAILARPQLVAAPRRQRTLLPEFQKMMRRKRGAGLAEDLAAVRAER